MVAGPVGGGARPLGAGAMLFFLIAAGAAAAQSPEELFEQRELVRAFMRDLGM